MRYKGTVHVDGGNEIQGYMSIGGGNEIQGYTWMREMRYKITCGWGK